MTTISETLTKDQYLSIKHSLLAACYEVRDKGYTIGSSYGVSCKDGFSWSVSNYIRSVNPLGAWLLSRQPSPVVMDFEYDFDDWDFAEMYTLGVYFYNAPDFFSGFVAGYDSPTTPFKELINMETAINLPVGAPNNDVGNVENYRLGVKLGKHFAKKFGMIDNLIYSKGGVSLSIDNCVKPYGDDCHYGCHCATFDDSRVCMVENCECCK